MSKLRNAALTLAFLLAAVSVLAQVRGDGRIAGKVVDEQGQPVQDVQVKAVMVGQTLAMQAKTNKKGEWAIAGVASGQWNVEFAKEGFMPAKTAVEVDEDGRSAPINVKLVKPAADPNIELQAEVQKAEALIQSEKYPDARKIYEDLLAKYPTVHQLHAYIARTYAGEKNYDKALEHLRIAVEKEPSNVEMKLLMGDLLMEKGAKEEGLQMLQSIDVTQVKNTYPLINASITLINDGKADQALEMLNRIVQQFPNQADTYYYRGRAYLAAKKMPEAKADLEKFVSMAQPDARELADAKKILEQLKDVK